MAVSLLPYLLARLSVTFWQNRHIRSVFCCTGLCTGMHSKTNSITACSLFCWNFKQYAVSHIILNLHNYAKVWISIFYSYKAALVTNEAAFKGVLSFSDETYSFHRMGPKNYHYYPLTAFIRVYFYYYLFDLVYKRWAWKQQKL